MSDSTDALTASRGVVLHVVGDGVTAAAVADVVGIASENPWPSWALGTRHRVASSDVTVHVDYVLSLIEGVRDRLRAELPRYRAVIVFPYPGPQVDQVAPPCIARARALDVGLFSFGSDGRRHLT